MENSIVSNKGRAKVVIYSIFGIVAVEILYIVYYSLDIYIFKKYIDGDDLGKGLIDFSDTFIGIIDPIHTIVAIISTLMFVSWISRAYSNLHLKAEYLNSTERWAKWLWFIPIVNIFSSRKLVNEIFDETNSLLAKYKIKHSIDLSTQLVTFWWGLLIINAISFKVIDRVFANTFSLEDSFNAAIWYLISSIVSIIAAYFAYKLVITYSSAEVLLNQVPDFDEGSDEDEDGSKDTPIALEPS